jgi:hypothetical protein
MRFNIISLSRKSDPSDSNSPADEVAMRYAIRASFGLLVLAVAFMGAAPWKSLPPCLLGKWDGITATDPNGNVIGQPDPSDWGCLGGQGGGKGSAIKTQDGVPVPPPSETCLMPAAPNPTGGHTVLRYSLAGDSDVSLVVYGKKGNGPHNADPVRTLVSLHQAAGVYSVQWDGSDDHGAPLSSGLYRVVLTIGDQSACGDIQIE